MITTRVLPKSSRYEMPYRVTAHDQSCQVDFNCSLTPHSFQRSMQRSISNDAIVAALEFGEVTCKQSLEFYFLGEKQLPDFLQNERTKYVNTVVVLKEGKFILTVYRNKNSSKKIAKKSKTLY